MSELLLIRLGSAADQPIPWLQWDSSEQKVIDQGQLADSSQLHQLTGLAIKLPCHALVPNQAVLTTEAQLPNNSRAARDAIPYQLEEQLCQEIEQLHFATGRAVEPGRYPVAVVDRLMMDRWQQWLLEAGLPVQSLLADAQTIRSTTEQPTVVELQQQLLISPADGNNFSIPSNGSEHWIQLAEQQLGCALQLPSNPETGLADLARYFQPEQAINLLQGGYKLKDPVKQLLQAWKLPAILLALVIALQLISLIWQNQQLQQHKQQLNQQIGALFDTTLPNTRKVNPKSQLQHELNQLSQRNQDSTFLHILQQTLPAFSQNNAIKIQTIGYQADQQSLSLELESPNHDSLERFTATLGKAGLKARTDRSRQQGDRVLGQLTIGNQP